MFLPAVPLVCGSQKQIVEKLWQEFFSDPSQWWDHRSEKQNARYPDFKHKTTQAGLWLNGRLKPRWVEAKLAGIAPGTLQWNIFSWNRRLLRYVKARQYEKTLELFHQMQGEGMSLDKFTFIPVLNACAGLGALEAGRNIHAQIRQSGCESDMYIGSSLVDMYAKCGSIGDAWTVFSKMSVRNVVSWNVMILGHVKCGQGEKALELSRQMIVEGLEPDPATFVGVLHACAAVEALEEGRRVHKQIVQKGCESDSFVGNSLVDMYTKCGSMEDAWIVFERMRRQDVVAWSSMIQGCIKSGQGQKALELLRQMQQEGIVPNPVTFVGMVNACASAKAIGEGRIVHELISQTGCGTDVFVGSSLIDMYAKCDSIADAWTVFYNMPTRSVVSWNAMILGYVKCGQGQKALELFDQMQQEGLEPDSVTFVGLLNACAKATALQKGRAIHKQIKERHCESDVFVGCSLIDMYAKCGSLDNALKVFNKMHTRDIATWNAMLAGYAMHGQGEEALKHFEKMCEEGVKMDRVTFVSLLSACSHAGLVDEGLQCFQSMGSLYQVSASVEHYASTIDLFSRAGHLHMAEEMIKAMSFKPDVAVWMSLLSACRNHGNVEMGERIGRRILELDPGNAAGYVLLSNVYAAAGKWESRASVQKQRLERGVMAQQGQTWIEVNNEMHSFGVDDQEHPLLQEICAKLTALYMDLKDAGYVTDFKSVLYDVEEDEKVYRLCHHSEKLAIAFGLISTPPGTPLLIFKNLRVCGDCHDATKLISQITGRSIIVRDANRFHHFEDARCSCRDNW